MKEQSLGSDGDRPEATHSPGIGLVGILSKMAAMEFTLPPDCAWLGLGC
ncbi:hypothetical protein NEA10_06280 [Phormidium yuhuli AB48]|uniref:Uncharacterized protein n=1 Tax=Phormidium yuhuli AB48 TaxID=2940671 RepID=A0ABY5ASX1_9CYAN|nr:hypothetical protein [Phormidium yuhuli]USR92325.1 hypothetical protein NEA10_06280 [Phormidium yuhuli AB48]